VYQRDLPDDLPANDLLDALFLQFRFLSYFRQEHDDLFALEATDHAGRRVKVVRESPETMARAALGKELTKACRACGQTKPLHEFARHANNKDGRLYRCKVCERSRVRAYQRRKAAS